MIHIGIDPDIEKPGVAIIKDGQYTAVSSLTMPDLFDLIAECKGESCVTFYVEDVNTDSATYYRHRPSAVSKQSVQNKISQHVGMCMGAAKTICHVIEHYGCNLVMVKPKARAHKTAKHEADYFQRITGWQGRTNQDSRDAAMLIFQFMKQDRKTMTKGE